MSLDLSACLVVGISSRALFDLRVENHIFETEGLKAYRAYQLDHEDKTLVPGSSFPLVKALLELNKYFDDRRVVEVIIMSKNSVDIGIRLFKSIQEHGLDITRAAFTSGESLAPYLSAFQVDLYLSKSEADVQAAVNAGFAGAAVYDPPDDFNPASDKIRIAFDGDAVLFSSESEQIYQEQGLDAWLKYDRENAENPLLEGPFAKFLKTLSFLQSKFEPGNSLIRIALVTARKSPAHERVIRTFRAWEIQIDEAFFLGGISKDAVLKAFRAHIFFDDQDKNLVSASRVVPSARVPYKEEDRVSLIEAKEKLIA